MASLILYYSAFALSSYSAASLEKKIKIKPIYYIAVIFLPVALASLRYGIGTDYFSYYQYYREQLAGSVKTDMELLFQLLNIIASRIFGSYTALLGLSSFITHLFVLMGLERVLHGTALGMGMYIFYCFYYSASLNTVRQLIALAIVFYASVLLYEGKYRHFIIFTVIASLFHTSALASLLLLPLKIGSLREDLSRILGLILAALSGIFGFFGRELFELLPYFIKSRYEKYLNPDGGGVVTLDYLFDILPVFLITAIPIFLYVILSRKSRKYDFFCFMGLSSLPVLILGYNFAYFQRLVYYFDSAQLACAPLACYGIKDKRIKRIMYIFAIGLYSLYFFYSSFYKGSNQIFPYRWII